MNKSYFKYTYRIANGFNDHDCDYKVNRVEDMDWLSEREKKLVYDVECSEIVDFEDGESKVLNEFRLV